MTPAQRKALEYAAKHPSNEVYAGRNYYFGARTLVNAKTINALARAGYLNVRITLNGETVGQLTTKGADALKETT